MYLNFKYISFSPKIPSVNFSKLSLLNKKKTVLTNHCRTYKIITIICSSFFVHYFCHPPTPLISLQFNKKNKLKKKDKITHQSEFSKKKETSYISNHFSIFSIMHTYTQLGVISFFYTIPQQHYPFMFIIHTHNKGRIKTQVLIKKKNPLHQ